MGGESGGYGKLTRDVLHISMHFLRHNPWALPFVPLLAAVPAYTLANFASELLFARSWARRLEQSRILPVLPRVALLRRYSEEAA